MIVPFIGNGNRALRLPPDFMESLMIDIKDSESIAGMSDEIFRNRLQYSLTIRKMVREMMKDVPINNSSWETLYQVKET